MNCRDLATQIKNAFPYSSKAAPLDNWLSRLFKSWLPETSLLTKHQVVKTAWNPKHILLPEYGGMLITRIALLLAANQSIKVDQLIANLNETQRYRLAGEASFMIRLADNDALVTAINGDSRASSAATALLVAGYLSILALADDTGDVIFPASDKPFIGKITPSLQIPGTDGDPNGEQTFAMFVISRIEAFARISSTCTIAGPLDTPNPEDIFTDSSLTIPSMPMAMLVSKLPQPDKVQWNKHQDRLDGFFPTLLREVLDNAFMSIEQNYLCAIPQNLPRADDIQKEIAGKMAYSLWPGVSDIQWEENFMRGLRLLPLPSGEIMSSVRFAGYTDAGFENIIFERMMMIPALTDLISWTDYAIDSDRDALLVGRTLSPMMEAIRMCVAPSEKKIRDGRVPTGFVSGSRKPSVRRGDISVVYLPKLRTISTEASGHADQGALTGITHKRHQVSGFIRQLPLDNKASDAAKKHADEFGIPLPGSGFTFVRPHMRGKESVEIKSYRVRKMKKQNGAAE